MHERRRRSGRLWAADSSQRGCLTRGPLGGQRTPLTKRTVFDDPACHTPHTPRGAHVGPQRTSRLAWTTQVAATLAAAEGSAAATNSRVRAPQRGEGAHFARLVDSAVPRAASWRAPGQERVRRASRPPRHGDEQRPRAQWPACCAPARATLLGCGRATARIWRGPLWLTPRRRRKTSGGARRLPFCMRQKWLAEGNCTEPEGARQAPATSRAQPGQWPHRQWAEGAAGRPVQAARLLPCRLSTRSRST